MDEERMQVTKGSKNCSDIGLDQPGTKKISKYKQDPEQWCRSLLTRVVFCFNPHAQGAHRAPAIPPVTFPVSTVNRVHNRDHPGPHRTASNSVLNSVNIVHRQNTDIQSFLLSAILNTEKAIFH